MSVKEILDKELIDAYRDLEDDINDAAEAEENSYLDRNLANNLEYLNALKIIGPYFVHDFARRVKRDLVL
jgi:hypothetical protein